jgi:hypothetical protein
MPLALIARHLAAQREHQDFEERHKFVRLQQSRQPQDQPELDEKAQPQIVHGKDSNGRTPFHWNVLECREVYFVKELIDSYVLVR